MDRRSVDATQSLVATSPAAIHSIWERLHESMQQLSASGRATSDPAALAARLAERTKRLRNRITSEAPTEAPLSFLAFNSGHDRYGIPLADIVEIQALEQFSPVPKASSFIPGVVHWRGAVLALLDLGKLFEGSQLGLADYHVSIIVETAGKQIAIIAREVEEIVSVPRNQIQPAPLSTGTTPPEWVLGVHDHNRLLLKMDQILPDARLVNWRKL